MRNALLFLLLLPLPAFPQASPGPRAAPPPPPLPQPRDHPIPGTLQLFVDATDTAHSIFRVTETIPVRRPGETVLLYPEWETTSHGPTASAVELAGVFIDAASRPIAWRRDARDVHAFHVIVPPGASALTLHFEYLSPPSSAELRPGMIVIPWQRLLLYPAGWYTRNLTIAAQLRLPAALHLFTALAHDEDHPQPANLSSRLFTFAPETLDRLVDAPVYAARDTRQLELTTSPQTPIHLDLLADSPADLAITPLELAQLRTLVIQTGKVFGPQPFPHYDVLVSLSDILSPGGGQEHLEEGENNLPANYLTDPTLQLNNLDLIAHEYVHAWNGRYRQPADLWSPTFNQPTDPSLLWVYEGQTEFWGRVLAARSGMRTTQQTLDKLALDADLVANRSGRAWKTLADSTLDVLYMPGQAVTWRDWQRREDYYPEGVLLWLDVDARLRELTHDVHTLDDFAHTFFATHGRGSVAAGIATSTYTFADICQALNALARADWPAFLTEHLQTHAAADATAGLARAGWRLTYTSIPTETFLQDQADAGVTNLDRSLGAQIRSNGTIRSVIWNGPAFQAGLAPGDQITEVNGQPFTPAAILAAIGTSTSIPIHVTFKSSAGEREVLIPYAGPLRYPHLERIPNTPDRLTPLLQPR